MTQIRRVRGDYFESNLQRAAAVLAAGGIDPRRQDGIAELVNEEIALVLSHLARVRESKHATTSLMSRLECEVGTDLLGMETPPWWYGPNREERWRDRQKLKARRAQLQMQRLRIEQTLEENQRDLEDRLLTLVQRRLTLEQVEEGDGDSRKYGRGREK